MSSNPPPKFADRTPPPAPVVPGPRPSAGAFVVNSPDYISHLLARISGARRPRKTRPRAANPG